MNWKNVAYLIRVDRKSGRLLRGKKLTKYRENRFLAYWVYWVALALGLAIGLAVGVVSNYILAADQSLSSAISARDDESLLLVTDPGFDLQFSFHDDAADSTQRR